MGYGDSPKTDEEFLASPDRMTKVLCDKSAYNRLLLHSAHRREQEVNGLYTYTETEFPPEINRRFHTTSHYRLITLISVKLSKSTADILISRIKTSLTRKSAHMKTQDTCF